MMDGMTHCTACGALLATPLATYGEYDAPMCADCYFALTSDFLAQPLYWYDPLSDGRFIKRLTAAGAIYLDGTLNEAMMIVQR